MNKLLTIAAVAAAAMSTPSLAQPIANPAGAGAPVLVNSNSNVIATYLGTSASFTNELYLVRPGTTDLFLFNNKSSAVGSTVDLGSFTPGTELVFRLFVTNTQTSFFSGLAGRNPDGRAHAAVESNYGAPGTTLVSFEDLLNGPFTYNDLSFSFSGTTAGAVPEPETWAMMILGLGGVGAAMRVRRRRVAFAA